MSTSSKRFIILMIILDVCLLTMWGFANNSTQNDAYQTQYLAYMNNMTEKGKTAFTSPTADTGQLYITKTFGDTFTMGQVLKSLTRGITGSSDMVCPDCPDETVNNTLTWIIGLFIGIINMLGLYELFMITINKKVD